MESLSCLTCSQMAYAEYENQRKKGISEREILVGKPMLAITLRIVTVNNMPVAVPTCMGHLYYAEQSKLAVQ
jgi:hypothetical protein